MTFISIALVIVLILQLLNNRKVNCIMATLQERFDALGERAEKIFTEMTAVKQALADLRAQGPSLTPEQEASLVRAEDALGRVDELNPDGEAP